MRRKGFSTQRKPALYRTLRSTRIFTPERISWGGIFPQTRFRRERMERPFVSILVDTYNHERFIEAAVASVLRQDYPASQREILIVDDGSMDRTP
jgi:cellulose synthase/poly-beta-1,6-N-acetylglucosamine synthase-like glycosyltransferase